ncbi:hypothetical protein SPRG_09858 [Saprolegnia parasitica CBS 223.65]|uniref:Bms1-type G domain-containing protein n=1 Tax=Saprolegnia parasitica (strain CBS 223.65) TaxID=695850 RepID=A0A067C0E8_SAPPC|nr:hypothetical protein SPRG_09858 [Saprolegnia parasitica CBS 223.65]KDO24224.1 hypothetical protein SPRG_09858 [Saprolegnia parasitica CBS 223.65]|eukprot:XP_012205001.1 hypothetical protein SPRG_09858 [Saprolegnia parasitica CBS 223.65]
MDKDLLGKRTKQHRKSTSGAKVNKKKRNDAQKNEQAKNAKNNPKAFGVSKIGKAKRMTQRNLDKAHQKEYVPQVDRMEDTPPPVSVVVMGPPGSGKSTLIRSLVKRYTRHNIGEIKGPVTVISGKDRRITFFECPNDLNAMIDLAKIADLVLLMVDASFGFEMETFEFLNILQVSGFPKVMGILTHLDKFKNNKSLRQTKKRLKSRFWTEIYQGAKLFYFSGIVSNKYPKGEINNMMLYIARIKFRPLTWRNSHPYLLVDRFEDVTHPDAIQQNPVCDRKITLYGYLRGTHLKPGMKVHVAGAGDFYMESVTSLPDPCPLPSKSSDKVKKHLSQKDIMLYAPMSDVGNIMFDKDAVYINLGTVNYSKKDDIEGDGDETVQGKGGEGTDMVQSLQQIESGLGIDERLKGATMSLFKNTAAIRADELDSDDDVQDDEDDADSDDDDDDDDEDEDDDDDDEDASKARKSNPKESIETDASGRVRRRAVFDMNQADSGNDDEAMRDGSSSDDNDSEDEDEDEDEEEEAPASAEASQMRWKDKLVERAAMNFLEREQSDINLMELVYGATEKLHIADADAARANDSENDDDDDDDDFFRPKNAANKKKDKKSASAADDGDDINSLDSSKYVPAELQAWDMPDLLESLRNKFVTGSWKKPTAGDDDVDMGDDDVDGSFEDLETGEVHRGMDDDANDDDDDVGSDDDTPKTSRPKRCGSASAKRRRGSAPTWTRTTTRTRKRRTKRSPRSWPRPSVSRKPKRFATPKSLARKAKTRVSSSRASATGSTCASRSTVSRASLSRAPTRRRRSWSAASSRTNTPLASCVSASRSTAGTARCSRPTTRSCFRLAGGGSSRSRSSRSKTRTSAIGTSSTHPSTCTARRRSTRRSARPTRVSWPSKTCPTRSTASA